MSRFIAGTQCDYLTVSLNLAVADTRAPNAEAEKMARQLLEFSSANPERTNRRHLVSYLKAMGLDGQAVKAKSPSAAFAGGKIH